MFITFLLADIKSIRIFTSVITTTKTHTMKTFVTIFRGKKVEVTFQDSNKGIMISWVGSDRNLSDDLTREERNLLITECFKH